ncbi:MAG: hypothetical protein CVU00_07875 [Bacteroidetes bacterium HGW-Bacteroidetes-17]|jgi:uncharacterized protein YdeI (YjbR/CyaY-like superfamily)|nr:MAG: hypothetical protein CVU00_07875 [Bacteroidetes bacterium HGW-Bacteroidetes-17]
MKVFESIHFKTRNDFREWLKINHNKSEGIWIIFYKKHTRIETISYDEALDEALCFGWIDSTKKSVDEETYIWKFTPRTNVKNWSDINKMRVNKLIKTGLMTKAGLNKIDLFLNTGKVDWKVEEKSKIPKEALKIPEFMIEYFSVHEPALTNFHKLAPSHQRNYVLWIADAKRPETRIKRLTESVMLLLKNEKLGMK